MMWWVRCIRVICLGVIDGYLFKLNECLCFLCFRMSLVGVNEYA